MKQREHNKMYSSYLEVHTLPLRRGNWGKLLPRTPQVYLVRIGDGDARRFIEQRGIDFEDLSEH